jgi:putative ATPase
LTAAAGRGRGPPATANAAPLAILKACADGRAGRAPPVPAPVRDGHSRGAGQLGRGLGYWYSHGSPGGWVQRQYPPEPRRYYEPIDSH